MSWNFHGVPLHRFDDFGMILVLSPFAAMHNDLGQKGRTDLSIFSERIREISEALPRFGQVDADLNHQYEGTGLGLPLTKALIELHGGALDLQSHVGVGTIITVRFPAERIVRSPYAPKS
jgi:hypothetical protein